MVRHNNIDYLKNRNNNFLTQKKVEDLQTEKALATLRSSFVPLRKALEDFFTLFRAEVILIKFKKQLLFELCF